MPKIEKQLAAADPKLGRLIDVVHERIGTLRPPAGNDTPFAALVRAVVYQQMAAQAARAIYRNVRQAVGGRVTPSRILALSDDQLRAAGLSAAKAKYVRNIAEWFAAHPARAKGLVTMSDADVIDTLTEISGVGVWTVNVLLIFNFRRLDVVSHSDLGIRRGVQLLYHMKALPTPKIVQRKAERWAPYRSIASMYLWQAVQLKITHAELRGR